MRHRRRPLRLVLSAAVAVVASLGHLTPAGAVAPRPPGDALSQRANATLDGWTRWLKDNKVRGYVGEVGWPRDDPRWSTVAEAWYARAEQSGVAVTTWVTGEWAGRLQLANYVRAAPDWTWQTSAPSDVMEANPGTPAAPHGVCITGPEMASPAAEPTSTFSNLNVGVLDQTYHYDGPQTMAYLAGRGMQVVRIAFRWERLQRAPYADLDPAELGRLRAMVAGAGAAGLRVVLDLHNYGAYYLHEGAVGVRRPIGSAELPVSAFADVWRRLAVAFADEPAVWAYGLMNEPVGLPSTATRPAAKLWEQASQAALDAIRATGERRLVSVAGYEWSGMARWATHHPVAWVRDPARNVMYEAHQYWNSNNSGVYLGYDEELALAQARLAAAATAPTRTWSPRSRVQARR